VAEHFTSKYLDLDLGPLLPFGHGLSTTRFELTDLRLEGPELSAAEVLDGARIGLAVTVTNTGERDGDDVLLLFVRDEVASIAPAVRRLAGFERVTLPAGASQEVRFELDRGSLGFWTNDPAGEHVVEPGDFTISVSDGATTLETGLTLP
jgi:beta-glucosidase